MIYLSLLFFNAPSSNHRQFFVHHARDLPLSRPQALTTFICLDESFEGTTPRFRQPSARMHAFHADPPQLYPRIPHMEMEQTHSTCRYIRLVVIKIYNNRDWQRPSARPSFPSSPSAGSIANMNDTTKKHSIEHFEFVEGNGSDTAVFIDPVAEKKLLRKIDLRILPP